MTAWKEVSIRRQLLRLLMLTSGLVLLVTIAALVIYERYALRNMLAERFTLMSRVIAGQCAAPLVFQNPSDAEEVLANLAVVRGVKVAGLYDSRDQVFAVYPEGTPPTALPPEPGAPGHRYGRGYIAVAQPVVQAGNRLGTLYLRSDLSVIDWRIRAFALIALAAMGTALVLAFFLSRGLQAQISRPVLALAETARTISQQGDYSVRAQKRSGGELGLMTDAFNRMLEEIQRRAQDLRTNEQRLRTLADSIPQLTWIAQPDGHIFWYNQRWYDYTGTTPEQMEGWGWQRIHDPQVLPKVLEGWRASINTGQPFEMEFPLRGADGQFRQFLTRVVPLKDSEGHVLQWFGTNVDITEIIQAREALNRNREELERMVQERTAALSEANRELEAFGYSVSHDLRAPLRHIDSYINMLQKNIGPSLDEKSQKHIRIIVEAARRMGNLIDDLLVLSRLSRATMEERIVSLRRLVDEARQELAPEMAGRVIEWHVGPLPQVRGDPNLLRSAVVNLLSNAIKYTRPSNPARIEIGSQQQNGELICFVRDNGAGFDMRFVEKLFGVFQRLHRLQDFEGTGIGLASVRRVIQRHGGRTWAEGALGEGATFYFSLPLGRLVEAK